MGVDFAKLRNKANKELKKVSKWFSENKLTLNISKSKFMLIKRGNKKSNDNLNFVLKFNGKKIERCQFYKYLGIYIDENLNWKKHVSYLCEKLSKICGIFAKLRHCCNRELMRVIYFALVDSHLQYCNIIWGSASEVVLKPLIKLQEKVIRIIYFAQYDHSDMDGIFKELRLLKLEQLNKLTKAKFVYKYKNQKLPSSFDKFLTANTGSRYALRSQVTQEFKCIWGKTVFGMKRIQYEGAQLWNAIPLDIRNAKSLREFAKKFKSMFF